MFLGLVRVEVVLRTMLRGGPAMLLAVARWRIAWLEVRYSHSPLLLTIVTSRSCNSYPVPTQASILTYQEVSGSWGFPHPAAAEAAEAAAEAADEDDIETKYNLANYDDEDDGRLQYVCVEMMCESLERFAGSESGCAHRRCAAIIGQHVAGSDVLRHKL